VTLKVHALGRKKAFILVQLTIIIGLVISVASFAATSTTSSVTIIAATGVTGDFGSVVPQNLLTSMEWSDDDSFDTLTVTSGTNHFAVGDYLLIDTGFDGDSSTDDASFHTVTAVNGNTLTISPDMQFGVGFGGAAVTELGVYSGGTHSWTPALNSATSVNSGNHFIVNLKSMTTSDAAFVEIIITNSDALQKNYTYLNRIIGVYVLCESTTASTCPADALFSETTGAGSFGKANDATGQDINSPPSVLTLQNSRVQFFLEGGHVYALAVEGGAVYTIDSNTGEGDELSPSDHVVITAR
jgi:hypothetical protein